MAMYSFSSPAGLTVTQTRWRASGVLAANKKSTSLPGLPGTLNPRPATQNTVSAEAGVAHLDQSDRPTGHKPDWCFRERMSTRRGEISQVYVFK
jgi:hypothetical protein